ncbi:MAG: GGDEF domain-containing protein [Burkholderiales bacterium]
MRVDAALFRSRPRNWAAVAAVAIVAVGYADYATGPEITFSVFYLIPVAFVAWVVGTQAAIWSSAFAAIVWLAAEYASSRIHANLFVYAWNFSARLLFLLAVALLLARLRFMLDRERTLSRTDFLTGLPNARACREFVDTELARARRYRHPLSIAFIDIDDFKRVNDRGGHAAGDRLLASVARVIRNSLRSSDFVARYGGDEFVVLLPVSDEAAARAVVEKLSTQVQEAIATNGWPISLSVGVVTCEPESSDIGVDALLAYADRLMYDVKNHGKRGARFATTSGLPVPDEQRTAAVGDRPR